MTKSSSISKKQNWNNPPSPSLTPEQTILWLEGIRELMIEVWTKNPELRKRWEMLREREDQILKKE